MTKVKLDADEIEERVSLNQVRAQIDRAGVITITTHVNEKGWMTVGRYAQAYVLARIASGRYVLDFSGGLGVYTVRNR